MKGQPYRIAVCTLYASHMARRTKYVVYKDQILAHTRTADERSLIPDKFATK